MRRRIARAALLVVAVLALSACEELDFLVDLYDVSDLTEAEDDAGKAAGHSPAITKKIDDADKTVQEVLNGDKPAEELDDLRIARPMDAKIATYVKWLAALEGDWDRREAAGSAASRLHHATVGGDYDDRRRLHGEMNLDVISDILNTQTPGPDADADVVRRFAELEQLYCYALGLYSADYGTTPEGSLYLTFANDQGCGVI